MLDSLLVFKTTLPRSPAECPKCFSYSRITNHNEEKFIKLFTLATIAVESKNFEGL